MVPLVRGDHSRGRRGQQGLVAEEFTPGIVIAVQHDDAVLALDPSRGAARAVAVAVVIKQDRAGGVDAHRFYAVSVQVQDQGVAESAPTFNCNSNKQTQMGWNLIPAHQKRSPKKVGCLSRPNPNMAQLLFPNNFCSNPDITPTATAPTTPKPRKAANPTPIFSTN